MAVGLLPVWDGGQKRGEGGRIRVCGASVVMKEAGRSRSLPVFLGVRAFFACLRLEVSMRPCWHGLCVVEKPSRCVVRHAGASLDVEIASLSLPGRLMWSCASVYPFCSNSGFRFGKVCANSPVLLMVLRQSLGLGSLYGIALGCVLVGFS